MGSRADMLVLGFMGVAALLSMWISNVAATLALYPVLISILTLTRDDERSALGAAEFRGLAHCMLLGVAYAASIGGLGTLIGTAPNVFLASYARAELGIEISFARWLLVGFPLVVVFLPVAWAVLVRVFPVRGMRISGVDALAAETLREMGPMRRGERVTLGVFLVAVSCWMLRPLLANVSFGSFQPLEGLTDSGIAILAALTLFLWPAGKSGGGKGFAGRLMDWETAGKLPFGLLLLFGGGLSLAAAITRNGTGDFLGSQLGFLQGFPVWAFVAIATLGVLMLTELTSNTATAATFLPVLAGVATGAGIDPLVLLVPAALAATCSFMLPVGTPPNAIVFASGHITIGQMARAGLWLNLIGVILITAAVVALGGMALGISW
jgi:solute carrier family 13 (sodium-dependent dicarboxylate transporter), member 2/3/5